MKALYLNNENKYNNNMLHSISPMKGMFFHTELAPEIINFFFKNGEVHRFKKKSTVPSSLVDNYLLMLKSGLVSNTQYISFCSKEKFSVFILPYRLVDHQLILIKEYTACKVIEVLRPSEVVAVHYDIVQGLIDNNVPLHKALLRECAYCSRRYMHIPIFISSMSAEKKAVRFFYDMIRAYDDNEFRDEWLTMPIKLTREEIANALYISLISFDLLLNRWHKAGMVRRENNHLVIHKSFFDNMSACAMESIYADKCGINLKY